MDGPLKWYTWSVAWIPRWVTTMFLAAVVACIVAAFRRARATMVRLRRHCAVRSACGRLLAAQGAVFVMVHQACGQAAECAGLYTRLMATASCPDRVFMGVFQEVTAGGPDVSRLIPGARDHLRVVNTTGVHTTTHAICELVERCMRSERTAVLIDATAWPCTGWDETLVDDLVFAEAATGDGPVCVSGPLGATVGVPAGFPAWSVVGQGTPRLGSIPFASPLPDTYHTYDGVVRSTACSTHLVAARAGTWRRMRPLSHPSQDLALSAALHATGATFFVSRRMSAHGSTATTMTSYLHGMVTSQKDRRLANYAAAAGMRLHGRGVAAISGRARMGLTHEAHANGPEVASKYGTRAFNRYRQGFT